MRKFRFLFIILIGSVATLAVLAFAISGSSAQDVTATPNPGIPTLLPACDAYYVTANSANIRACAAAGCTVVAQLPQNSMVCVLGEADTSKWYQVDLAPEDPSSPIVYVSADVVARGAPTTTNNAASEDCQSYTVGGDSSATVYSCPGTGCKVLGVMGSYEWMCVFDYSGQYPGWLYATYSDSGLAGWVQNSGLKAGRPSTSATDTPGPPTWTSEPRTPAASQTIGPPTMTPPSGAITLGGSEPVCQQYHVVTDTAQIRTCAGANCDVAENLARDETLCVRGITDNPEWYIVDLEPDAASTLYAVHRVQIAAGLPDMSCEPWEVIAPVDANVRECASLTCQIMGKVNNGDWVCAREFGGAYRDWVLIDIPGGRNGVWISSVAVRPLPTTGEPTAAFTPSGPMACQPYTVNVDAANVRTCASTDCAIAGKVNLGNEICVYGPATGAETTWFMADLTPADPNDAMVYISQNLVTPVAVVASVGTPGVGTPNALVSATPTQIAPPTTMPTPTPFVTLLPTAAVTTNTAAPATPILSKEVVLSTLNVRDFELVSPRGSNRFRVQMPDDWYMDGNSVLYLNIEYFETRDQSVTDAPDMDLTSLLTVRLDSEIVSSITLDASIRGQQTLAIPLPASLLAATTRRNHSVEVTLDSEEHCLLNSEAKVFVRTDMSFFHFEFRELPPSLDLALYPRPFYNKRFADDPESVLMVLPLDPLDVDMQAAARLSAGLGFLTGKGLQIKVVSAEDITDQERQSNNLLLVGQLGTNPLIDQMYAANLFHSQLDGAGNMTMSGMPIDPTNGVVDMAINPYNSMRAVVAVTGKTPDALLKAAQSLAGPPALIGLGGPLAVVSSARPVTRPPAGTIVDTDITFTELGYSTITMNGIGVMTTDVEFFIPLGQSLTSDAYVDLMYSYSELLGNGRTSVALLLNNDTPLASEVLDTTDETNTAESAPAGTTTAITAKHLRAWIPPSSIIPGEKNVLSIVVTVDGNWQCVPPDPSVAWFNVSGDSFLHLPRQVSNEAMVNPVVGWFPIPFNAKTDLSDVWISLPNNPSRSELEQAFEFAAALGSSVIDGEGLAPHIQIGDMPPGTDLSGYHFVVLGRPSNNSFLAMINASLPQPFLEGTDQLEQKLDDVSYVLPPGYEVGVLEVLTSPWSENHAILVVTGTGAASQTNAANALLEDLYWSGDLLGDVVFISNSAAVAIDTRLLQQQVEILTQVPELETQTALLGTPAPANNKTSTPGPTLTLVPTETLGPSPTASPLFTPTIPPTSLPTLIPMTFEETQPADSELPSWFPILLAVTGGALTIAVVFGVVQSMRRGRSGVI